MSLRVENGQQVRKGDRITDGSLSPHDVLRISGEEAVQEYLTQEVLAVYRQQGVDINDKHIEVIIRQMMRKVKVDDPGDTELLSGTMIDVLELAEANRPIYDAIIAEAVDPETKTVRVEIRNRCPKTEDDRVLYAPGAVLNDDQIKALEDYSLETDNHHQPIVEQILMGITKASLATESFLSAASFQETTKVLTEAAIKGKVDHLVGLKENVIIGKLIPAGSGMAAYRDYQPGITPESEITQDMIDNEGF